MCLVANNPLPPAANWREWPETAPNTAPERSIHLASSSYAGSSAAMDGSISLARRGAQLPGTCANTRYAQKRMEQETHEKTDHMRYMHTFTNISSYIALVLQTHVIDNVNADCAS